MSYWSAIFIQFQNFLNFGKNISVLQRALLNKDKNFEPYRQEAEDFICRILPSSPFTTTQYTQGIYKSFQSQKHPHFFRCILHITFTQIEFTSQKLDLGSKFCKVTDFFFFFWLSQIQVG